MSRSNVGAVIVLPLAVMAASVTPGAAESWDFRERTVSLAVSDERRSEEQFHGTKIGLEGRFFVDSVVDEPSDNRRCCSGPSLPEHFYGLVDLGLRWGLDGTGLEYVRVGGTPWATLWEPEADNGRKLRATGDLVELLAVRYIDDDPLGVDSYLEVSGIRAGRMGVYRWSDDSAFTVVLGGQASVGWAWAESSAPSYSEVSNPFAGLFLTLGIRHERWGEFYSFQRYVNGFSFSNPSRGHPTAREARVRFGLLKQFGRYSIDLYYEKRSFYFDEGNLPALYTEVESPGLALHVAF